jgi:acyl-CoA oxidase
MVGDSANTAKRALTIATRYAAIRRQFSSGKGKVRRLYLPENPAYRVGRDPDSGLPNPSATINGELYTTLCSEPLADYQPLVAQSIAMGFTSMRLQAMYQVSRTC